MQSAIACREGCTIVSATRLGVVLSITMWSIAAALQSIARGISSLGIFRSLLGLGEAGNWPGATKSAVEYE